MDDWEEVVEETNATDPDTDGDGVNDGDEQDHGTDPLNPDSFPDNDEDGICDLGDDDDDNDGCTDHIDDAPFEWDDDYDADKDPTVIKTPRTVGAPGGGGATGTTYDFTQRDASGKISTIKRRN